MPSSRPKPPLSPRSGVVRHSDKLVALHHALARVPHTERVDVVMEHNQTGVASRSNWSRVAICIALRKGAASYGIYETVGRAKLEGFGLVTTHPTLPSLFLFINTTTAPTTEEAP